MGGATPGTHGKGWSRAKGLLKSGGMRGSRRKSLATPGGGSSSPYIFTKPVTFEAMGTQAGTPIAQWSKYASATSVIAAAMTARAISGAVAGAQIRTLAAQKAAANGSAARWRKRSLNLTLLQKTLEASVEESHDIHLATTANIALLRVSLDAATAMLNASEASKEDIAMEHARLQRTLAADVAVLAEQRATANTLSTALVAATSSHASFVEESDARVAALGESLADAEAQQAEAAAQLRAHAAAAEADAAHIAQARAACEQLETRCAAGTEALEALRAEQEVQHVAAGSTRAALEARVATLQSEVEIASSELTAAIASRDALASTEAKLQQKLAIAKSLLKERHSTLGVATAELDAERTAKVALSTAHAAELVEHSAALAVVQQLCEDTHQKLSIQQTIAAQMESKCEVLTLECNASADALATQRAESVAHERASQAAHDKLHEQTEQLLHSLEETSNELCETIAAKAELDAAGAALATQLAAATQLAQERGVALDELKSELAAATARHEVCAEQSAAEHAELRAAVTSSENALRNLQEQHESHIAEAAAHSAAMHDNVSSLQTELSAKTSALQKSELKDAELTAAMAASENALRNLQEHHESHVAVASAEQEAMSTELTSLQTRLKANAHALEKSAAERAKLSVAVATSESALRSLQEQQDTHVATAVEAMVDDLSSLKSELAAKISQVEKTKAQEVFLSAAVMASESALRSLQEHHESHVAESAELCEAMNEKATFLQSELDRTAQEHAETREEHELARVEIRKREAAIAALASDLEETRAEHEQRVSAAEKLRKQQEAARANEAASAQEELRSLNDRHSTMASEHAQARQYFHHATAERDTAVKQLNVENATLRSERDTMTAVFTAQLAKFKQEKATLRAANAALRLHARAIRTHRSALESHLEEVQEIHGEAVESAAHQQEAAAASAAAAAAASTVADEMEFETEVVALPVPVERSQWAEDASASHCKLCADKFNLFRRRHHCRSCGDILCGSCSSMKLSYPWLDLNEKTRACTACYDAINPKIEHWRAACHVLLEK